VNTQSRHLPGPWWRQARHQLRTNRAVRQERLALARELAPPLTATERADWQAILGRYDDRVTEDLRSALELVERAA
jgi:hypothetical protein